MICVCRGCDWEGDLDAVRVQERRYAVWVCPGCALVNKNDLVVEAAADEFDRRRALAKEDG